ncbi:MAG: glutamate--tRNA ligase family protein [Candidatus Limnocylindrales bacterium]
MNRADLERIRGWTAATRAAASHPITRFAPAPSGLLHLGHVANAIMVWGVGRAAGGTVVLRIEDHDRSRCRPDFEARLLDDLDWLGFAPDVPTTAALRAAPSPYRQSDSGTAYRDTLERLRATGATYACRCTRSTFAAWTEDHDGPWRGPGCPGGCRRLELAVESGLPVRIALGEEGDEEAFDDVVLGRRSSPLADVGGDPLVRGRDGSWTYAFAVVVDDARHGVDLVIRGSDLLDETPRQVRLGRLLGRNDPPRFLHHPLILKPNGAKLSKADGDTSIGDLRTAGASAETIIGRAALAIGLIERPGALRADEVEGLFG